LNVSRKLTFSFAFQKNPQKTDRSEERNLKMDILRLNKAAKDLNTPDKFVYYAKVKREIEMKRKRLESIQNQRQQSRIVTYSQSASFFIKYFAPIIPMMLWWNTPMFQFDPNFSSFYNLPTDVSIVWWSLLCNALSYRIVSLLE
jgi:hypothetical protein